MPTDSSDRITMPTGAYFGYYNSDDEDSRSNSPYPPSTPGESNDEGFAISFPSTSSMVSYHPGLSYPFITSLESTSDSTLREIVVRVASGNPWLQQLLLKEMNRVASLPSSHMIHRKNKFPTCSLQTPPTTPTTPRSKNQILDFEGEGDSQRLARSKTLKRSGSRTPRKTSRSQRRAQPSAPSLQVAVPSPPEEQTRTQAVHTHIRRYSSDVPSDLTHENGYHPGQMQDEAYEFISRTPGGAAFKVVQTITMWNCCDGDEWSPGCVRRGSSTGGLQSRLERNGSVEGVIGLGLVDGVLKRSVNSAFSRPVSLVLRSADIDGNEDIDYIPGFAIPDFSAAGGLEDEGLDFSMEDVYPDSDLESPVPMWAQ
ncbi:hypothetical protein FA15DRAFT_57326 [Coprinopsis marcescibilis]|uniref:Uncharacterized protein n=1 Tax=Coprinopsis marcescibilis TaxID=230819 RepID=A0A5C3KNW5_COPMA|nr:hypothetical protein FA15DRAFT_57326 [Coprinopsis marcescibilis]